MSSELHDTIFHLRDEVSQLTSDALAMKGDKSARWHRAQEIKALAPALRDQVSAQPADDRKDLESALAKINRNLIFLLADSNRPDDVPGEEETMEEAVRRIYAQSLQISADFALERGDREALIGQADELHHELIALAKSGANQQPDWMRMISDADLDLTYVTSGGLRPHSTRLAYYLADARRSDSGF
jgi:hypothetical protein